MTEKDLDFSLYYTRDHLPRWLAWHPRPEDEPVLLRAGFDPADRPLAAAVLDRHTAPKALAELRKSLRPHLVPYLGMLDGAGSRLRFRDEAFGVVAHVLDKKGRLVDLATHRPGLAPVRWSSLAPPLPRPSPLPLRPENVPALLRGLRRWVGWEFTLKGRRWDKPPLCVATGRHASSSDPRTWCDFDTALREYHRRGWSGLGLVLRQEDGIVAVDVDNGVYLRPDGRPSFYQPAEWVLGHLRGTYVEASPSGRGLRAFVRGKLPGRQAARRNELGIEIYAHGQYVTVTGQRLDGAPAEVAECPEGLPAVYRLAGGTPCGTGGGWDGEVHATVLEGEDDERVVRRALDARNGEKFHALYFEGDTSGYESASEADAALVSMICFWVGTDVERVERIARCSALAAREKWEREDYLPRTIESALNRMSWPDDFYDPARYREEAGAGG